MVHLEIDAEDIPTHYQLLAIDASETTSLMSIDETRLPADWRSQIALTRALGDDWLRDASSALLSVPSAIVPEGKNYLLNPAHADSTRVTIISAASAAFDPRLIAFLRS
jgi:RES domain-containing protein